MCMHVDIPCGVVTNPLFDTFCLSAMGNLPCVCHSNTSSSQPPNLSGYPDLNQPTMSMALSSDEEDDLVEDSSFSRYQSQNRADDQPSVSLADTSVNRSGSSATSSAQVSGGEWSNPVWLLFFHGEESCTELPSALSPSQSKAERLAQIESTFAKLRGSLESR